MRCAVVFTVSDGRARVRIVGRCRLTQSAQTSGVFMSKPEVVIVGGGPAGSSCAILLALRGHRVLLLERERFPRFMIGESLLPAGWDLWDRLGVRHRIEDAGYPVKRGVLFRIQDTDGFHEFLIRTDEFPQYFVHPFTFHVDRAHFDRMLLERARE